MEVELKKIKIDKTFADRLPPTNENLKKELTKSIENHGIIVPVLLSSNNILLDGHRRLEIAKELGVDLIPALKLSVSGSNKAAKLFEIAVNLDRRHLNEAQRADLGSSLLRIEQPKAKERQREGGSKGGKQKKSEGVGNGSPHLKKEKDRATDRVAKRTGVSRKTFERVMAIKKSMPKLAARMIKGEISVAAAYKKLKASNVKKKGKKEAKKIKEDFVVKDLASVPGKWRTVYMDPPWRYDDSGGRGAAENHYSTMSVDELIELPVKELAHSDGCLYWIWTTWPMIRDGYPHKLIEGFGLRWVGEVVWHKLGGPGTGRWLRPVTEVLVLAVSKGAMLIDDKSVEGFLAVEKQNHSKKPEEFYEFLERVSPEPRIELFARNKRDGWWRWGLEA